MTAVLSRSQDGHPGAIGATGGFATVPSRWDWRNWPVVVKLAAVLIIPTIVALVAGVLRIVDQAGAAPAYLRISQIVQLQQQLSDLVGSLERERDLATAFVATGRMGDRRSLDAQFRTVDTGLRAVGTAAAQVSGLDFARSPLGGLGALAPLRASVTTGFGPVEVVVTEYSDAIDPLIELDAALTRQLDDVAVTNQAAAVHDLLSGREQVARQHAIVSAALYTNRLGPGQIEDLRTATVRLTTDQDAVRAALGPADRASVITGIGPDAELSRQRLLQLVLNRGLAGQPLEVAPQDWDQRSAVVVGNFIAVEKGLRQRINQTAQGLLDRVRTTAGLNSVILFFALGLGVLVGIVVTRALLRPLAVLKRTALDVADRRLPEAMARIRDGEPAGGVIDPVPVGTREEIGQVARAFDEVHSQAVRLATEQAELRANVNDIFVSLSRRTQGLVERQLKLIDRLESGEQDPQQLDNLFQLDHLATRMRRNSENLLVLAGTDVTSRSGRPVRLIDVLRAAVSEVEQYQRLVLQQPPAVLVLGRTANDLVHLLAELLDNATQFSPPESHVMVSSDLTTEGAVTIEVADRGVGMTDEELAEANQRLASHVMVDASVSRRMGLFVVGRLAGRHGIEVQLRRGEAGVGIWATVLMPPRLVRLAVEPVDAPEAVDPDMAAIDGPAQRAAAAALEAGPNDVPAPRPHADPEAGAADGHKSVGEDSDGTAEQDAGKPAAAERTDGQPAAGEPAPSEQAAAGQAGGQTPDSKQTSKQTSDSGQTPDNQVGEKQRDGKPATDDQASGKQAPTQQVAAKPAGEQRPAGQPAATNPPGKAAPDQRSGNRPAPMEPPPAPPGPPASPAVDQPEQIPGGGSGDDLFRPAQVGVPGSAGPGPRVTLRHSTPIFDDVATAWFKEHEAVPVRWTAPSPGAPVPDAPADDVASPPPPAPAPVTARTTAGPPPLVRRQPGKTLAAAESGTASKPGPSGQPEPVPARPAAAPDADWGAGDEGWRAAQVLATPVATEMTATGLPRRQPRALLVPGAVSAAKPTVVPARSAESIRGRLASYQQGTRQGREARASGDQASGGPPGQSQDGEENAT
ncbi:MAG TPA: nitrate- and nitrite sensing domain-containing protein [Pseudonocardiaceae bacterium]|nr:nitrate- and nitrite sensing domain-containing protein [Pseudonocardiaceae bacterium]